MSADTESTLINEIQGMRKDFKEFIETLPSVFSEIMNDRIDAHVKETHNELNKRLSKIERDLNNHINDK